MLYWGLDSFDALNRETGTSRKTLVQRVLMWVSRDRNARNTPRPLPHFWGRYLKGPTSASRATPLTPQEIVHLSNETHNQCRVLLIYVGAGEISMAGAGRLGGASHARAAASLAMSCLPGENYHGCIYLDIEPGMLPTKEWLLGWWLGMEDTPFVSGVYCNLCVDLYPLQSRSLIRNYCEALEHRDAQRLTKNRYIWASQRSWVTRPLCVFPTQAVLDQGELRYPGLGGPCGLPINCGGIGQDRVVLYQYWKKCKGCDPTESFLPALAGGTDAAYFDMNLATQQGFDSLWRP